MRTFDMGAVIYEETWEGYRDWTEASGYYGETDAASISTPSIAFEDYTTTGQRQHLALTINNTSGSTQSTRITQDGNGLGIWVHNTVLNQVTTTVTFRYKADAGLAGVTVGVHLANNPFAFNLTTTATADGEWHAVSGEWETQVDANLFTGNYYVVSGIADGAEGVVRFDDLRVTRNDNIQREIDSACPVVPFCMDWGNGFRETYGWASDVQVTEDGSEYRESLRLIPTCRLEFTVIAPDAATAGFIEQWLYRYHGAVVAVPRWVDAIPLASVTNSGHTINLATATTARWFQPRQRFMLWTNQTTYEAELIDLMPNTVTLTVDPNEGAVSGTFAAGTAVVPLVPGRLVSSIPIGRPNALMGVYPLAFDVQMIQ